MYILKLPFVGALVVAAVGCSSSDQGRATAMRGRVLGAAADGGAGMSSSPKPTGFAGTVSQSAMFVDYEALNAGSSGSAADMGGNGAIPAGCEVGKFCAPQVPDSDHCGTLSLEQEVQVERTPGNLLLIFDQSGSMGQGWGDTGQSKLQAAQQALTNAITTLQDSLTVGAIFFPTAACVPFLPPPPGGAVLPIDGMGQIPFQPGPVFLQSWAAHFNLPGVGSGLGTPMQEAFDRADTALTASMRTGATAVVVVTDGQPNCFPDPNVTMTPTDLEVNRSAQWLSTKNIKTYVVGLPGAQGVRLLTDVAASGGSMQYIVPDDPATLEARLKEVVQEQVKTRFLSCSIALSPAADPPEKLQMVVVEVGGSTPSSVPHDVSPTSGWVIDADGTHVELTGDLCTEAMSGRFQTITFEYPCKVLPPLKPVIPS